MTRTVRLKSLDHFEYVETEEGYIFPGEAHPEAKLIYVDQGVMHIVADGQDLLLRQGEMVLCTPNQWHMRYAEDGHTPRFVTMAFQVEGADLASLSNRSIACSQRAAELLRQMLRELERMDSLSESIIMTSMELLLLTLLREAGAPAQKLATSHTLHSENQIIRRAQQYISAHVREKLSVPLIARKVDVSPSYLTALFHKHLEISPGEYVRRVKLQESKMLIRQGNLNFTEIAAALNYSTVHHFSRQFKENFGITPTEYAKSVR